MTGLRILVVGGGIAGLSAAHFLGRDGHQVTVIDKARRFEPLGHVITLKGAGVKALEELGLLAPLRAQEYDLTSVRYVDIRGREMRRHALADNAATLGGYVMCNRADLHRVLHDHLPSAIKLVFGLQVRAVTMGAEEVTVAFSDGASEAFDVVLGADGVHSALRAQVLPDVREQFLHGHYIAFVANTDHGLDPSSAHMIIGRGRNVNLMPHGPSKVGVVLYQDDLCRPPPEDGQGRAWRPYFQDTYRDYPGFVRDVLAAAPEAGIFADRICLVPADHVATDRVALLGDAGYCPTFMSGMGAASALQGAYALAAQLRRGAAPAVALENYQARILPVVRGYQASAYKMRKLILSRSPVQEGVRNLALRMMPASAFARRARAFYHAERDLMDLAA